MFISEHYTQRVLEHGLAVKTLTANRIEVYVDDIVRTLRVYQDMLAKSKFVNKPANADVFVAVERFIFTFLAVCASTNGD